MQILCPQKCKLVLGLEFTEKYRTNETVETQEDLACAVDEFFGSVGCGKLTSFYGHLPKYVLLYGDELEPRESIGFEPNEDLPLDTALWVTQARDNQLERALDYIHSK